MTENQPTVRLKYLTEIDPPKSEVSNLPPDTEVSFIPLDAFGTNGNIEQYESKPLEEVYGGYTYFQEGDIAIAKITPSFQNGKGAICEGLKNKIGFGTTELYIIRPKKDTSTKFLWYSLRAKPFIDGGVASMRGVAGQQRVTSEFLKNYEIIDISPARQQRIATFLDHHTAYIDALINKNQQLLELLNEKRMSTIEKLLKQAETGEYVKLKYVIDSLPGYSFSSDEFSSNSEDIRLLRGINVGVGEVRWDETAYWPNELAEDFEKYRLKPDDIVLGLDRPWISNGIRIAQLDESDCPSLLVQRVLRIRSKPEILQKYILLNLSSERFRQYFEPITTGVSVPHISNKQVGEFEIPLPTESCQSSIISRWEIFSQRMHRLEDLIERSIDLLQEKRQSLITAAVTGQIDVSDWEPPTEEAEVPV